MGGRAATAGVTAALSDVAREAKVSPATASRALNPTSTHPMREATKERVLAAAAGLGYQPNLVARGLRKQHLPMMAVVVHDITDAYFAEIVKGATMAAARAGYLTIVCSSDRDPQAELDYVGTLSKLSVAAVLFAGGGLDDEQYQRTVRQHQRTIQSYGGVVVALAPRAEKWPAEVVDNRGGAAMAVRHLADLGHRSIVHVAGPSLIRTSREREQGYREAMAALGLEPLVIPGDFRQTSGAGAVRRLLDENSPFTALFLGNDVMALGAISELQQRGLRVPRDISIVGFDDIPGLDYGSPGLTTVRAPMALLGAAGVSRALKLMAGGHDDHGVRVHSVDLVIRGSTAPARER